MCVFGWIGFVIIYLWQRMATGLQGEMLQLHQAFLELEVLCSKSDENPHVSAERRYPCTVTMNTYKRACVYYGLCMLTTSFL